MRSVFKKIVVGSVFVAAITGISSVPGNGQVGGSADSDFLYAQKLFDDGMYQLSAQLFGSFIKNYPTDSRVADARYYTGLSFFNLKEYESARQEFQYLAIEFPQHTRSPQAWEKVGECYDRLGNLFEAANAFARIEDYYPDNIRAVPSLLKSVDYYLAAGKFVNAKEKLAKLIRERPNIPEVNQARLKQAVISRMEGGLNTAVIELTKVMEASKDRELAATALFERAKTYELLGRIDDTRKDYITLVDNYANTTASFKGRFELGVIYLRENDFKSATEVFSTVVSEADDWFLKKKAQLELGDIEFLKGNYDQALEAYSNLFPGGTEIGEADSSLKIESVFKTALTHELLGDLKSANERYETLLTGFRRTRSNSDFFAAATVHLARNYAALAAYNEALKYFDLFLAEFADHSTADRILFERARLQEEKIGDFEEASADYRQLIESSPKSSLVDDACFALGRTQLKNGEITLAKQTFQKLRIDYPGSDLFSESSEALETINRYYVQGDNETLENIILLIGDLIEEKPKDILSYEYGRLFYEQLKNYKAAATLFEKVIATSKDKQLVENASYLLAYAFKRLAEKDPENLDTSYAAKASAVFQEMIKTDKASEAAIQLVELKLGQIENDKERAVKAKSFYKGLLERYPASPDRDLMLLRLGTAFFELGIFVTLPPAETSEEDDAAKLKDAVSCFEDLINKHPQSKHVEEASFNRAMALFKAKKEGAEAAFEEAIEKYPRSQHVARSSFLLGKLKEQQSNFKAATGIYNDIINRFFYSPVSDSAALGIGDTYMITGRFEEAIKAYRNAGSILRSDFPEIDVLDVSNIQHDPIDFKTAACYDKLGNYSQSKEYFQRYLAPNNEGEKAPEALYAIAELEIKRGNETNGIDFFEKVAKKFGETQLGFEAANKLAQLRMKRGEFEKARTVYETLVKLAKNVDQQMYYDARVIITLYRMGDVKLATQRETIFEEKYKKLDVKSDKIANHQAEFLYELGQYYQYTKKNFAFARQQYEKILSKFKKSRVVDRAEYGLGVITIDEGKSLKEGIERLMEIPKKYPYSEILADVYFKLAVTFFNDLEDMESAIASCKAVLKEENVGTESRKRAMNLLIKIYKAAGLHEQTLLTLKDYLRSFPDTDQQDVISKKIDVGIQYKNLKEYDRAIQYFKDLIVVATGEDEAEIQFNIGETYFQQGKYDLAVIEYLKIPYLGFDTKLDWATPAKSQAAESYKRLGKYDQAISLYKEIIAKHGSTSQYGKFSKAKIEEIEKLKF